MDSAFDEDGDVPLVSFTVPDPELTEEQQECLMEAEQECLTPGLVILGAEGLRHSRARWSFPWSFTEEARSHEIWRAI